MTSSTGPRLDSGSRFPQMTLSLAGGESLALPDDWAGHAGAVLFYRGHW
ncbi:MAG: hypothetical protein ABL891_03175 [Burkholderiales bacterium]